MRWWQFAKELEMVSVVSGILEDEARTGGGSRQNDRALFVSTQGRTNQGRTSLCYNCNKPGHFNLECTAPKESNDSSNPCQPNVPPRGGPRPHHHHRCAPKHQAKVAATDSGMEDSEFVFCTAESGNTGKKQGWIVDSRASCHMTWQRDRFITYNELPTPQPVKLGDGREVNAIGQGQVKLSQNGVQW